MKHRLLSLAVAVAMLVGIITAVPFTASAAVDYSEQYIGDGFTRLTLTDTAFAAGTERTFTVNIMKDGEYAVFLKNADATNTGFTATFSKDGETQTVCSNTSITSGQYNYEYIRLGVANGQAIASVPLTKGVWTLSITSLAAITVPYIDIRSTSIEVDGSKLAIYPVDMNSLTDNPYSSGYVHKYVNDSRFARNTLYTYHGDLTNSKLSVTSSGGGAILLYVGRTATYKLNVKTAGDYKIVARGRLRSIAQCTEGSGQLGAVSMTIGENEPVKSGVTFDAGTASSTYSDYIDLESVLSLEEGENTIVITNESPTNFNWYFNYITVEAYETEEDGEGVYSITKDEINEYVAAARALYPTDAYADYKTSIVSSYVKGADAASDKPKPVTLAWDAIDGAESYTLYVSVSDSFPEDGTTTVTEITDTTYDIYNLLANTTYYWKVSDGETESDVNTFKTKNTVRYIRADSAYNIRDIGGWNGINQGLVFRGSELNKSYALTEDGIKTLHDDLGIKTDLDLRNSSQLMKDDAGNYISPIGTDVALVCVPISNYTAAYTETYYYGNIARLFADSDNYPVYFHCQAGADRTGTVAFVIEAIAGVSEEDLCIDFELTSFSQFGLRTRVDGGYYYASTVARMKTYKGNTLQEKAENYAMETLGLTRAEVSNIQSILAGNGVTFETPVDICADAPQDIVLKDLGDNEIDYILFGDAPIEYSLDSDTVTLHTRKSGTGEIVFTDGTSLSFGAYSENDITFEDISNNQIKDHVISDLNLPEGYVWSSSRPDIVSETGKVTRPLFMDAEVTLTATNDIGEVSITFKVKALKRSVISQNAFTYPELAAVDSDTAVVGTTEGGSIISGLSVQGADVPTSITTDNKLSINFLNADTTASSGAGIYFALDEPVDEKMVVEFDTYVDSSQSASKGVHFYIHAEAPDGTVVKKRILNFDASSSDCIRSVGFIRLNAIGSSDISGINGNTVSIRIEIDPVKMLTRYAGAMNSAERPTAAYSKMYGDILSSNTSNGTATIYYTTSAGTDSRATYLPYADAPAVNYKILGFSLVGNAKTTSPYTEIDNMLFYTENDAPIKDATFVDKGSSVEASLTFTSAYTGKVIIALYDGDNKLVGIKITSLTSKSGMNTTVPSDSAAVRAEIYLFDAAADILPLYQSSVVEDTALEWE